MALTAFADAPPELSSLAQASYAEAVGGGMSEPDAEALAYGRANAEGYFVTGGKWEKIGPQRRVAFRTGELQPNGKYLIRNVPVFYPNAVKDGPNKAFTPEVIERCIENTNSSMSTGTPPGLSKGHPSQLDGPLGNVRESFGSGMNFRNVDGQTYCDLFDVDPEVFSQWKDRKWTGLSAGIVGDAGDTGLRFGHIALLGAESPALSRLQQTLVYSAPKYVCFSSESKEIAMDTPTEPAAPTNPGTPPIDEKTKALETMKAAYAAFAAGEPGAKDKLRQAHEACMSAHKPAGGEFTTKPEDGKSAAGAYAAPTKLGQPEPGSNYEKPEKEKMTPPSEVENGGVAFSTLQAENAKLAKQVNMLLGIHADTVKSKKIADFSAEIDKAENEGYAVDRETMLTLFSAASDNDSIVKTLVSGLRKIKRSGQSALSQPASIGLDMPLDKNGKVSNFAAESAMAKARVAGNLSVDEAAGILAALS